jgi:hypothetical protein
MRLVRITMNSSIKIQLDILRIEFNFKKSSIINKMKIQFLKQNLIFI